MESFAQLDVQGHRGCRGLLPENSIPAFLKAVELGVNTLEMDVVISGDRKVVVSHEAYFSSAICTDSSGKSLSGTPKEMLNIFQMDYDKVRTYDCGSKGNSRFPDQKKMQVHKPLLSETIDAVEKLIKSKGYQSISYNIEIKSDPGNDGIFHPAPAEFCELVVEVLRSGNITERCIIQSFDMRTLRYLHKKHSDIKLALLTETPFKHDKIFGELGFKPFAFSPYFRILTRNALESIQSSGIKVIPWTVNKEKDMRKLIRYKVDGIITDYPDLLLSIIKDQRQ